VALADFSRKASVRFTIRCFRFFTDNFGKFGRMRFLNGIKIYLKPAVGLCRALSPYWFVHDLKISKQVPLNRLRFFTISFFCSNSARLRFSLKRI